MNKFASIIAAASVAALSGGCATVAVYEPEQVAEISLVEERSDLEKSSDAFHDMAEKVGWADNQDPLAILGRWFGKDDNGAEPYWQSIKAETAPVDQVIQRVRADATLAAEMLERVNGCADALITPGEQQAVPARADVAMFEKVLISSRQARSAFEEAIKRSDVRSSDEFDADILLFKLDAEIDRAAKLADDLAGARMSGALSSVDIYRT